MSKTTEIILNVVATLVFIMVIMIIGGTLIRSNVKTRTQLDAIYIICEDNAHENPISWTIMDIINGEDK